MLRQLFAQVGPCVILMDELVAFMRAIEKPNQKVRSRSFGTNLSFLQALTEAVRATPMVMLIVSIPESEEELGGPEGKNVLTRVAKVFGRVEEVWQPVEVQEPSEVVRYCLFGQINDTGARDAVVRAYGDLYRQNPGDFPVECREGPTSGAWPPVIPSTPKCSTASTRTGPAGSGSSARAMCCA